MSDSMEDSVPEDLYPVAILIDELKHDEVQYRLNSMKHLQTIATTLGPERTRDELLPYISDDLDDEDSVLFEMARQLGNFIPFIGGPAYAHLLLAPLEGLATTEETTVRKEAVRSLNVVIEALRPVHIPTHVWSLLNRLREQSWFASRMSASGILARVYSRIPANIEPDVKNDAGYSACSREECLAIYEELSKADQTSNVRRAACSYFPEVATAVAKGHLEIPPETEEAKLPNSEIASKADGISLGVYEDVLAQENVPPPVPKPVNVSCASQADGIAAAAKLFPLLDAFAKDRHDGIRLLAVDSCVAFGRLLNGGMENCTDDSVPSVQAILSVDDSQRQTLVRILVSLAADVAWRVRWSVCNRLGEIIQCIGKQSFMTYLYQPYLALCKDAETEVRIAAAHRIGDVGNCIGREAAKGLMTTVTSLVNDDSEYVRAGLSSVILSLAPVLGTDASIERLLPLFLRLLKDSSPQVRLNVISRLERINAVVGLKMLSESLIPAIEELSYDKLWRVREAIIAFTPLVAKQLGSEIFSSTTQPPLSELCIKWLVDPVHEVRLAAAANLHALARTFGPEWTERVLWPQLTLLRKGGIDGKSVPFQTRMTVLSALAALAPALTPTQLKEKLLPLVVNDTKDRVPNIRFAAARYLGQLGRTVPKNLVDEIIIPALTSMAREDVDIDVKFFAEKAIQEIKS